MAMVVAITGAFALCVTAIALSAIAVLATWLTRLSSTQLIVLWGATLIVIAFVSLIGRTDFYLSP
jgi:hypothetical protein